MDQTNSSLADGSFTRHSDRAAPLLQKNAKGHFLQLTRGMRCRLMADLTNVSKGFVLQDPDMWPCVRKVFGSLVELFFHDVEGELERNLDHYKGGVSGSQERLGPTAEGAARLWLRLRSFVLYHYLPCDKSIFGKLRDPVYIVFYVATLVPVHGMRVLLFSVLLLMLAFPAPPDEYQLINFILIFKGVQFLSSGVGATLKGCIEYFVCYSFHKVDMLGCVDSIGPGSGSFVLQFLDYMGSAALVWVAFLLLGGSRARRPSGGLREQLQVQVTSRAGGRLRQLMVYDMCCFAGSLALLAALSLLTCGLPDADASEHEGQYQGNMFWCSVTYSFSSIPFALFVIPGLQTLLTHSDITGYNRNGACVPFAFDLDEEFSEVSSSHKSDMNEESRDWLGVTAQVANKVLNVAQVGRLERGGMAMGEWRRGDFRRGLWVTLTGLPSLTLAGRRMRGADAASRSSPLDLARGWWALCRGRVGRRCSPSGEPAGRPRERTPKAVREAALMEEPVGTVIPINSVSIPEFIQAGGHVYYRIQVCGSDDLHTEWRGVCGTWCVNRSYLEFRGLANRLGWRCRNWRDAPFPGKFPTRKALDRQRDLRRKALEVWLNRAVRHRSMHESWALHLADFLEVGSAWERPGPCNSCFGMCKGGGGSEV